MKSQFASATNSVFDGHVWGNEFQHPSRDLTGESVDDLVIRGTEYVLRTGCEVKTRAGAALQSINVNYILLNSRDRLHLLRKPAVQYFARELAAYFGGSLNVHDGLAQASRFWLDLAGEDGSINSNYGYYVFHEKLKSTDNQTQYEWVRRRLLENADTRRAMININQPQHKSDTRDFPCTVSLHYFVSGSTLCCEVFSRSTDVITGLPYDMGFFSALTELLWADLRALAYPRLRLGYTMMRTIFTQIYEGKKHLARRILTAAPASPRVLMPPITDAAALLRDIYAGTANTAFMRWVNDHCGDASAPGGAA